MIVKHKFQLYKLLVTKLLDTKSSGYQIFRLPNRQVTKFLGYLIVRLPHCWLPSCWLPNCRVTKL